MSTPERTSYCLPCDRVIVWRTWRVWQKHLQSADRRECVLAPRPLPPGRIRAADHDDHKLGLAEGESVVFHRPDGSWIGRASLGGGATHRIEARQRGIAIERLARHLGPDAAPAKQLCLRCGLILDPVIVGHHTTSREDRARKDPWLEPVVPPEAVRAPTVAVERRATTERFIVTMEPMLISVADAARVLRLSTVGDVMFEVTAETQDLARAAVGTLPRLGRPSRDQHGAPLLRDSG